MCDTIQNPKNPIDQIKPLNSTKSIPASYPALVPTFNPTPASNSFPASALIAALAPTLVSYPGSAPTPTPTDADAPTPTTRGVKLSSHVPTSHFKACCAP